MFPLDPKRAARLLYIAAKRAGRLARLDDPEDAARVLRAAAKYPTLLPAVKRLIIARRREGPLHAAADAHKRKIAVALRYAFAMGRAALGHPPNADRAADAVRAALEEVLPSMLRQVVIDGGVVGAELLAKHLNKEPL
jgi:hypothetical protein